MISNKVGDAWVATNLEGSNVQQEPKLTSKCSVEPCSIAEAAAKNAEPLSSHLIVHSNGISNANAGIDSECSPLTAKDAEGDTTLLPKIPFWL